MSDGRRWNAACKYSRRNHKKNYPDCPIPDREVAAIKRERKTDPSVLLERKRKRDRDRIASKRDEAEKFKSPTSRGDISRKAGKPKVPPFEAKF